MRDDILFTPTIDAKRDITIKYYPDATWTGVATGEPEGAAVDVTSLVASCTQGPRSASLKLRWHDELTGNMPDIGVLFVISDTVAGFTWWAGSLEAINGNTESVGTRTATFVLRSRDSLDWWRRTKFVSESYPVATDLGVIAQDILTGLGLTDAEQPSTPNTGVFTPHSNTQMANMGAWEMLTGLFQAVGEEPNVDAVGRFKSVSRNVARATDRTLDPEELVRIVGQNSRPGATSVTLAWLDKVLVESVQQEHLLASASITSGFFQLRQEMDVYWSDDQKQRARDTRMEIVQSANSGLISFTDEKFFHLGEFGGTVEIESSAWSSVLIVVGLALLLISAFIPDGVAVTVTVPIGRIVAMVALILILIVMMSIGTGMYEFYGKPFDYVHAVNKTEAYANGTKAWARVPVEITNDFISDEEHAQNIAVGELLYESLSANTTTLVVADDPRYERGDIVDFLNGARLYITGYKRNLTPGKEATVTLTGFQV